MNKREIKKKVLIWAGHELANAVGCGINILTTDGDPDSKDEEKAREALHEISNELIRRGMRDYRY